MPRGHLRKRAKSSWTIYYEAPPDPATGKRRQRTKTVRGTKKEAEKVLADILASIDKGTYVTPTTMTLAEFLERWLRDYARPNLRATTVSSYEVQIRKHIIPALGGTRLDQLAPAQLQDFYHAKLENGRLDGEGGLSRRTVAYFHMILRRSLSHAVKWQMIPRNPADAVESPKAEQKEMKYWNREQVQTFLESIAGHRMYALYYLALSTGLRQGELLGLRWEEVSLEGKELWIRRVLARTMDGKVYLSAPKTDRSVRSIALSDHDVDILRMHRSTQAAEKLKVGEFYEDNDLVFSTEIGTLFHPRNVLRQFKEMAKKAGVPPIRFHDLRHTHATLALASGVHYKVVQERLGHSKFTTTLDIYGHLLPNMQSEAAETIARAIFQK